MNDPIINLPSGNAINANTITWAENLTWRQTTEGGRIETFEGVAVHFIGGTQMRFTGHDALAVRSYLSMPS